jgi:translation elongation factor EF-4
MTGYATFNYEEDEYRVADLIKVVVCVNGDPCDPLSFVSHSSKVISPFQLAC